MTAAADLFWPPGAAEEALDELVAACRYGPERAPRSLRTDGDVEVRLADHARRIGIDLTAASARADELDGVLARAAPAIVAIPQGGETWVAALIGRRGRRLELVAPGGRRVRVPVRDLATPMRRAAEARAAAELGDGGDDAARRALVAYRARRSVAGHLFLVRARRSTVELGGMRRRARRALAGYLASILGQSAACLVAWWFLAAAAVRGHTDPHLVVGFGLGLLTAATCRIAAGWFEGRVGMLFGAAFRARAMAGALRLEPDLIRHEGVGRLMGRAIDVEAIERLGSGGGLAGLVGVSDLIAGAVLVVVAGAGPWVPLTLLGALGLAVFLVRAYLDALRAWTDARLELTHDLIEKLAAHRTRLIQLPPDEWNAGEDRALAEYLRLSRRVDGREIAIEALLPRGFLLASLLVVGALLANGLGSVPAGVTIVGALLAWNGLVVIGNGVPSLCAARLALERARLLLEEPPAGPHLPVDLGAVPSGSPLVELATASYAYPRKNRAAVMDATASVLEGDRILLCGPSGGGKSTLAGLLAGDLEAQSGAVLLHGVDRPSLGLPRWRRRVVLVPQFHQNHVFAETLAFNLQLGREWPPTSAEIAEAEALLRELLLGPLLDRMPSGLFTRVGDTGWQLSHGERSRVFLARALLQKSEVVIFDESLSALDPTTLDLCMQTILRRAKTVILIAHP